jgi:hypothetical protein
MYAKSIFVYRNGLLMGFDGPPLMGCGLGRGSGPIDGLYRGLHLHAPDTVDLYSIAA